MEQGRKECSQKPLEREITDKVMVAPGVAPEIHHPATIDNERWITSDVIKLPMPRRVAPGKLVSHDGFSVPSRVSLLILHTHSGCIWCLWDSSRGLNLVFTRGIPPDFRGGVHLFKPPYASGSVPSLSGHITAYR